MLLGIAYQQKVGNSKSKDSHLLTDSAKFAIDWAIDVLLIFEYYINNRLFY
jgi:hypothetical protein